MVDTGLRGDLESWSSRLELKAKIDRKMLTLDERVYIDEPELFLEVEKKNQKVL